MQCTSPIKQPHAVCRKCFMFHLDCISARHGSPRFSHTAPAARRDCISVYDVLSTQKLSWSSSAILVCFLNRRAYAFVIASGYKQELLCIIQSCFLKKYFKVNQLFSFSSDKDRRTDSRIRRKNTAQPRRESNPGLRILVALIRLSVLLSLSELKEKSWLGMIPTRASLHIF